MTVALRPAPPSDAVALSLLAGELFPDACPAFMPREAIAEFIAENLSVEAFRGYLAHPAWRCRVAAAENGTLLAYTLVDLSPTTSETVLSATGGRHAAYLSKMYARREVRGTGVAEALCRDTLRALQAEGQEFAWLGTHVDNARANAFYERMGFAIIGERVFDVGGVQAQDWVRLARL